MLNTGAVLWTIGFIDIDVTWFTYVLSVYFKPFLKLSNWINYAILRYHVNLCGQNKKSSLSKFDNDRQVPSFFKDSKSDLVLYRPYMYVGNFWSLITSQLKFFRQHIY